MGNCVGDVKGRQPIRRSVPVTKLREEEAGWKRG